MITCTLDLTGFRNAVRRTVDEAEVGALKAARKAAQEGAAHAKAMGRFKDRTGNLRNHIHAKFESGNSSSARWSIVAPEKYAKFVEWGTKPHIIRPKAQNGFIGPTLRGQTRRSRGGAGAVRHSLVFTVDGKKIFARLVHHPGAPAHPFMAYALRKAETVLWRELGDTARRIRKIWDV